VGEKYCRVREAISIIPSIEAEFKFGAIPYVARSLGLASDSLTFYLSCL
jgi:hypothetical protein